MEKLKVMVSKRDTRGKGPAKRLKKSGAIPAVVYSESINISLTVPLESMKILRSIHFSESTIINMEIDQDSKKETMPVIIKNKQFNPLTEAVTHIDFLKVSLKEKIKVHIPLVLKGEAQGVKDGAGVLTQSLREVEIEGLPLDMPENIQIDISELTIGHSIHVEDLKIAENLSIVTDPGASIVSVAAKKEEPEEEVVAVEGEAVQEPEVIKEKKGDEEAAKEPKEGKQE